MAESMCCGRRSKRVAALCGVVVLAGASTLMSTATQAAGATELTYTAAAGEANDLTLVEDGPDLVLTDTGASALPRSLKGCTAAPVAVGVSARCVMSGPVIIHLNLGDGDDHILADMLLPRFALDVDAGPGDDSIEPGDGNDRIVGGEGDDTLYGGYGNDQVLGQAGDDYVNGSPGADVVDGGGGFDFVLGDAGADRLIGGGDIDYLFGSGGNDVLEGGPGPDYLDAGGGDDTLLGAAGDDELNGGAGSDVMDGGAGNDLLVAREHNADTVICGAGDDVARVDLDGLDTVHRSCERVREAEAS
jgi:Ca2+-binding RTX toxin-like protein